jgi:peptidoglycan-N-acetylglucosamine deacetylase
MCAPGHRGGSARRSAISGLAVSAALAAGGAAVAAPVCFSPQDLAFKSGEQLVQKHVRAALVDPPRNNAAPFTPVPQRGVVRRVKLPEGKKLIALTFDLCEQTTEIAGYQGDIVDTLRANQVPATFFAGGKWMLTHKTRTQQMMADPLFEVGNHTWEHRNLRLHGGRQLIDEIQNADLAYEQVRADLVAQQCTATDGAPLSERAPARMSLFRFPYGACKPEALAAVASQGHIAIQWDLASGDPARGMTPQILRHQVVANAHPGDIVVFHANGRGYSTAAALPAIIADLRKQNYEFVTVSNLMAAGEPVFAPECYDHRPGDLNRYDSLSALQSRPDRGSGNAITAALGFGEPAGAATTTKLHAPTRHPMGAPQPRQRPGALEPNH